MNQDSATITPHEMQKRIMRSLIAENHDEGPAIDAAALAEVVRTGIANALVMSKVDVRVTTGPTATTLLADWWQTLPDGVVVLSFAESEKDRRISCIAFDPGIVASLFSCGLGGLPAGEAADVGAFELRFALRMAPKFAAALREAAKISSELTQVFRARDESWPRSLAIPVRTFEFAVSIDGVRLTTRAAISGDALFTACPLVKTSSPVRSARMVAEMRRARMPVEVVLRLAGVNLGRLLTLRPGDVIKCTVASLNQAEISVRGRTLFIGQVGQLANTYSVRISQIAPAVGNGLKDLVGAIAERESK